MNFRYVLQSKFDEDCNCHVLLNLSRSNYNEIESNKPCKVTDLVSVWTSASYQYQYIRLNMDSFAAGLPLLPIVKKALMKPIQEAVQMQETNEVTIICLFDISPSILAQRTAVVGLAQSRIASPQLAALLCVVHALSRGLTPMLKPLREQATPQIYELDASLNQAFDMEQSAGSIAAQLDGSIFSLSNDDWLIYGIRLAKAISRDRYFTTSKFLVNMNENETPGVNMWKDWPSIHEGVSVIEFFSGIGGFRLALPGSIHDVPIRNIDAYDCSAVANAVYSHNFCDRSKPACCSVQSKLHNVLIESIKLHQIDGKADLWTLSPPCQPYTTTRGAKQRDRADNRSGGIYHLMNLLKEMKLRPRYIILENVVGFVESDAARDWKHILHCCGYVVEEYILSPADFNIPNNRRRYYIIAIAARLHKDKAHKSLHATGKKRPRIDKYDIKEDEDHCADTAMQSIDTSGRKIYLSAKILTSKWAPSRLSIVGPHDTTTYCFTKSYGRLFDKSSGSCYLEDAIGPLACVDSDHLDRSTAGPDSAFVKRLANRLRLFLPEELLALSGFPLEYRFPVGMPVKKQYACIGNSINVFVVRALLLQLFNRMI
eukprot:GSChrysophyteH1.ASY1.ANO1.1562.1 assembled CDS